MLPRLPSISPFLRLALLTALAAAAGYWIGEVLPMVSPVPAAVTAVVTTQSTASRAWRMGVLQVLGIIAGALVAVAAMSVLGYGALTIFLVVLVSYGIVLALKRFKGISAPEAAASIAISVIIVVGSHLSTSDTFDRFLGVVVGSLIGLAASFLAVTKSGVEQIAQEVDDLYAAVALVVGDISGDLGHADEKTVNSWIGRVNDIRAQWREVNTELTEIEETAKYSPLVRRRDAAAVRRRFDALGMSITRLAAVTSDLKVAAKKDLFAETPDVVKPLAALFEEVAVTLDPETEAGSRSAVNKQAKRTVEAASEAEIDTEEFVVVSGLAQNARRLLPPADTGLIPAVKTDNATDDDERPGAT